MAYNAEKIEVLKGLEPVRTRPGMYIGNTGRSGLNHLVQEIIDNAVDEHMAGYCTRIDVVINEDGELVVSTKFTGDLTLEQISFEQNSPFFSEIFGIEPVFKQKRLM